MRRRPAMGKSCAFQMARLAKGDMGDIRRYGNPQIAVQSHGKRVVFIGSWKTSDRLATVDVGRRRIERPRRQWSSEVQIVRLNPSCNKLRVESSGVSHPSAEAQFDLLPCRTRMAAWQLKTMRLGAAPLPEKRKQTHPCRLTLDARRTPITDLPTLALGCHTPKML